MPKDEQQDHQDSLNKTAGNPIRPLPQGTIEAKNVLELKTPINAGQVRLHPKDFFLVFLSPESVFGKVFSQQNYFTALPEQTELSVWSCRKNGFLREIRYNVSESCFRQPKEEKGGRKPRVSESEEGARTIPIREIQRCRYDMSTQTFLQEIVLVEDASPSNHYVAAELRLVAHANPQDPTESCSDVHLSCDVVMNRMPGPGGRVGPFTDKQREALVKSYTNHFTKKYARWIGGANKFLEKQQISSNDLKIPVFPPTASAISSTEREAPVKRRRWTAASFAFMSCVWLVLLGVITWNMLKLSRKMCHSKNGKWAKAESCQHFNAADAHVTTLLGPVFAVAAAQFHNVVMVLNAAVGPTAGAAAAGNASAGPA